MSLETGLFLLLIESLERGIWKNLFQASSYCLDHFWLPLPPLPPALLLGASSLFWENSPLALPCSVHLLALLGTGRTLSSTCPTMRQSWLGEDGGGICLPPTLVGEAPGGPFAFGGALKTWGWGVSKHCLSWPLVPLTSPLSGSGDPRGVPPGSSPPGSL